MTLRWFYKPSFLISVLVLGLLILMSCTIGYKNDGKEVTWHSWNEGNGHNSRKVDADPNTFEELSDDYGRDYNHAFYRGDIIKGADGGSFRAIGKWYAADKVHVYLSGEMVESADPATFTVHSYYFAEDENYIYWRGKALNVKDKSTFKILGNPNSWRTKWAKDRYNGYYLEGGTISGIDYETFHPIDAEKPVQSGSYAADKNRVYFMDMIVSEADPMTFKEVAFYIGQDKYRVYKKAAPTQIKEYSKLERLGDMYADEVNVYDRDFHILPDADVRTFEHIEQKWYKDKSYVWWDNIILNDADPKTFNSVKVSSYRYGKIETMSSGDFNYGKDENNVFFRDSIIQGADPGSFEKIDFPDGDSWTVFDRNRVYQGKDSPKLREYLKNKYGKR